MIMHVLVTGGAGFIGSHVVDSLVENGQKVTIVDDLSTGKKKNINQNAKFYQIDINSNIIEDIFKNKVDFVIHLAAQVSVPQSFENPSHDAKANINGSLNLISLAKKYNIKKFIYINSAAIFGEPEYLPIDEIHPQNLKSYYAISKSVVEKYLEISELNFVSLRLANVYGPRQSYHSEGGVVANFVNNIKENKKIIIHGNGEQTRDFIFVKDVVNAIISSLDKGNKDYFNIGTGKETSINDLVKLLVKITGYNGDINTEKKRDGDIKRSVFSTKKAGILLKWRSSIELKNGLINTIEHEKEYGEKY
jgi:UDP-glucose 4-epimerase